MLKLIVIAYQNFSMPQNMSGILGIGYGARFKHLFNPQKSVMTLTVLFFFGYDEGRCCPFGGYYFGE
jgi:hypothetical protein